MTRPVAILLLAYLCRTSGLPPGIPWMRGGRGRA